MYKVSDFGYFILTNIKLHVNNFNKNEYQFNFYIDILIYIDNPFKTTYF